MSFRSCCTVPTKWVLPLLIVTLFVINLGLSMSDLPSIRLMQDFICKKYYNVSSDELLPEEECRGKPVQRELNIIDVGMSISTTIGGALVALPLGIMADRIGRIPVLSFSILSLFLSQGYAMCVCWWWKQIPIKALWGSGAVLLLGGGRIVAEAMVFTIVSDVTPKSQRATSFQWVVGAVLVSQLLGPVLAGRMVQQSVWIPLCFSLGLILVGGLVLVLCIPETLTRQKSSAWPAKLDRNSESQSSIKQAAMTLFSRPAIYLLPGAVFVISVATVQSGILVRLMPIQFDWPLDRSVLLVSLSSLVTLLSLLIILPGLSHLCNKRSDCTPLQRDRILVRSSTVLTSFGSLCLLMIKNEALVITGQAVFALGSGTPTLCRALLLALTDEQATGFLFGALAVGETLGLLGCELGMGWMFDVGLHSWLGLSLCLGLVFSLGTLLTTWMVPALEQKTQATASSESISAILRQI